MRQRLQVSDIARQDLFDCAEHIARDNLEAALRFLEAADRSFERLALNPLIGRKRSFQHRMLAGVRSSLVEGFENYVIFYLYTNEGVDVIRVLLGARELEPLLRKR